jgi:Protein of unknown function, DUF488
VAYCDYPDTVVRPGNEDRVLDGVRSGAATSIKGTVRGEKKIAFHGYPGREVEIDMPGNGVYRTRCYLVKQRLYQLTVVSGWGPPVAEDVQTFFDSFQLIERLWPRGISKKKAAIDLWLKALAPSTELRQWYGHDPAKWPAFRKRYCATRPKRGPGD